VLGVYRNCLPHYFMCPAPNTLPAHLSLPVNAECDIRGTPLFPLAWQTTLVSLLAMWAVYLLNYSPAHMEHGVLGHPPGSRTRGVPWLVAGTPRTLAGNGGGGGGSHGGRVPPCGPRLRLIKNMGGGRRTLQAQGWGGGLLRRPRRLRADNLCRHRMTIIRPARRSGSQHLMCASPM
jgi:hypothetical protein